MKSVLQAAKDFTDYFFFLKKQEIKVRNTITSQQLLGDCALSYGERYFISSSKSKCGKGTFKCGDIYTLNAFYISLASFIQNICMESRSGPWMKMRSTKRLQSHL